MFKQFPKLTFSRLLMLWIFLWVAVISLTSYPAQAQTLNRAVFPEHEFAFDYPDTYVLSHQEQGDYWLSIHPQYPIPAGLEPHYMEIRFTEGGTIQSAIDSYQDEYPIADVQLEEDTIGGQTATIMTGHLWAFERRIGFVQANGRVYRFDLTPDDITRAPRETELANLMWDTIVGSVDFDPPELDTLDTDCEDDSSFVEDVTIPDGFPIQISVPFVKTWRLHNDGTCTWKGDYRLQFIYGTDAWENMTFASPVIPYTEPGEDALISLTMLTPPEYIYDDDTIVAQFQLANPDGDLFGTRPYVQVHPIFKDSPMPFTPTPPPTVQPSIESEPNHPGMLIESFTVVAVGDNTLDVSFVVYSDSPILSTEIAWENDNGQTLTRNISSEGGATIPVDMDDMAGYDLGERLTLHVTSASHGIGSSSTIPMMPSDN